MSGRTGPPAAGQAFHTDHGRTVAGGGGIVPDVAVRPDSTDLVAARALNAALGKNVPTFNDALAAYALDARARRAVDSPTFEVTPEMRAAFLASLARRGVTLDAKTVSTAQHFIDEDIGYEVAEFNFGRAGSVRRLFDQDPVLLEAVRYASQARTPADLLSLAQAGKPGAAAQRP